LLAYLEHELVASRYDLKQIYRLILKSRTYQLAWHPEIERPARGGRFRLLHGAPPRRGSVDRCNQPITGSTEKYISAIPEPFTFIPESERTIALADASISSPFLELFGRSPRDTGLAAERNDHPTGAQRSHMLNSGHIQNKIGTERQTPRLLGTQGKPRDAVDALYLTILSRYPTDEELKTIADYKQPARPGGVSGWTWHGH